MTHKEAIEKLPSDCGYPDFALNEWYENGRIPLLFIPDIAHKIGCKPEDLSDFFNKDIFEEPKDE